MPDPSVALIVAAKDASATIGKAVASALAQPGVAQVVVVDDGSRDDTAAAAAAVDDGSGRLSILRLERNLGPSAARNRAVAASTAPLIGILDADDYFDGDRIGRLLAQAPGDWDFLADNMRFKRAGREAAPGELLVPDESALPARLDAASFVCGNLADPGRPRRELGFLKPLMRRAFLDRHGLGYDETLRLGEDYALYAQALLKGAAFWLARESGYVAIEHPGSLSGAHGGGDLAALAVADERLIALAQGDVGALQALRLHRRATCLKRDHALAIEAKRQGRYGSALRSLLRTPRTTAHILGAAFKSRLARLRG